MSDVDKAIEKGRKIGRIWNRSPKWFIFIAGGVLLGVPQLVAGCVLGAGG